MASDRDEGGVEIAEMFGDLARLLSDSDDLQQTLEIMVAQAVELLHGCEYAGISLVEGRTITSPASSNDVPRVLDAMQSELQEGPCIDSIREQQMFQTGDLAAESDRWPRFARRANEETGVRSILSIRLFVEEHTMGALNMYSRTADAFDETDVALATVFAAHASVAMLNTRREAGLRSMAEHRDIIGQAKGILMARQGMSDHAAFDVLRKASQRLNLRLRDVAGNVVSGRPNPPAGAG